ncbi:hypothetical protein Bxe_C0411 [Paraburkholderia xenovorans LB400]|uniref:Uncharacterized protein n=1 Tax=Paraburkholderia xenovorans (strain LB400) TaxID=266265 RepID=Q13HX4_PARXL|nr:hypothetical protein Bxe_C0411 [Paraburkholderia xenovorans LB400]
MVQTGHGALKRHACVCGLSLRHVWNAAACLPWDESASERYSGTAGNSEVFFSNRSPEQEPFVRSRLMGTAGKRWDVGGERVTQDFRNDSPDRMFDAFAGAG